MPDTGLNVSPLFCHVVQAGGVDGELCMAFCKDRKAKLKVLTP